MMQIGIGVIVGGGLDGQEKGPMVGNWQSESGIHPFLQVFAIFVTGYSPYPS